MPSVLKAQSLLSSTEKKNPISQMRTLSHRLSWQKPESPRLRILVSGPWPRNSLPRLHQAQGLPPCPPLLSITFATQAVLEPLQILLCSKPPQNANWGSPEECAGSPRAGAGDTVERAKHSTEEEKGLRGVRDSLDSADM